MRGVVSALAAVTGSDSQSDEVAALLPDWFTPIRGESAAMLLKSFEVQQTPSIFEIENGKITGRAIAGYGLVNFLNLVNARAASDASEIGDAPVADDVVTVSVGRKSDRRVL